MESFHLLLDVENLKNNTWRAVIRDFVVNKLSKIEFSVLIKNERVVKELTHRFPQLNHK